MVKYSGNLYETLESETGMATGYRRTGSVSLATNQERLTEYKRNASLAKVHGVDVQILSTDELKKKLDFLILMMLLVGHGFLKMVKLIQRMLQWL